MTERNIQGVPFRALSPCLYELLWENTLATICTVSFDGRRWFVNLLLANGRSIERGPFHSRDEAVALIAGRNQERIA